MRVGRGDVKCTPILYIEGSKRKEKETKIREFFVELPSLSPLSLSLYLSLLLGFSLF